MRVLKNVEMKEYSHMKVGGIAKELIFIQDRKEFKEVLSTRDRVYFLGNGTNTLIDDGNLDISFISLKDFQNITVEEKKDEYDLVRVEAGLDLDHLIDYMEKNDYTGLENIAGIPGSVGGLVNMNGGAYGTEIFDCIEEVEICDSKGEIRKLKKSELTFKYRTTEIKENKWVVISALFKFKKGFDRECAEDKRNQRETKHPLDYPNLGSTFKNPEGDFAARLISECGLKGTIIGNAQIAEKHPNFVLNLGGASFEDIINILTLVKKSVFEKFGVKLEEEIIIVR